jgi:hypothetical protein
MAASSLPSGNHRPAPAPAGIPVGILVDYRPPKRRTKSRPPTDPKLATHQEKTEIVQRKTVSPNASAELWREVAEQQGRQGDVRPRQALGLIALLAGVLASLVLLCILLAKSLAARSPASAAVQPPAAPALEMADIPAAPSVALEAPVQQSPAGATVAELASPPAPPGLVAAWVAPAPKTDPALVARIAEDLLEPAATALPKAAPEPPQPDVAAPTGECYGTAAHFLSDPTAAAKQATKEHKLLFVLNISGNFEDDKFT